MTSPAKFLTLPDEILLQVIKHYLAVPKPAPRLVLLDPCSGDSAVLKLTCKRLNLLMHDVENGKAGQMSMLVSSPHDLHQLLTPTYQRVQRLIFADIVGTDDGEQDDKLPAKWQHSLIALLKDLTKTLQAARQCSSQCLSRLKHIEIWPDTRIEPASTARAPLLAGPNYHISTTPGHSFVSALYDGLTPLCSLLSLTLTIHSLEGTPDLYISQMPPVLRFISPLQDLPRFSPQIPIEAVSQREDWSLIISPQMSVDEVGKRTIRFLHGADRRMMARTSAPDSPYSARVWLEYDPSQANMSERQDLVHLIRQGVIGLAGGYSVSTDLQGKVKISIG